MIWKVNWIRHSGVTSNFGPPQDLKNEPPIPYLVLYGLKIGLFACPRTCGPCGSIVTPQIRHLWTGSWKVWRRRMQRAYTCLIVCPDESYHCISLCTILKFKMLFLGFWVTVQYSEVCYSDIAINLFNFNLFNLFSPCRNNEPSEYWHVTIHFLYIYMSTILN